MKRSLLTLFVTCAALGAFGQGVVQFRNYYAGVTPTSDAPVYAGTLDGSPVDPSSPLFRAALIGGPTTGTPANLAAGIEGNLALMYNPTTTTLTWVNFRSGGAPPAAPGYVTVVGPDRVVPGVDWGGTALVQMVAWYGPFYSWVEAFSAWEAGTPGVGIGASNPLTLTLPSGPTDPNRTFLTGLQTFFVTITIIPEPTAFALAGLGAAVLLHFRRRN